MTDDFDSDPTNASCRFCKHWTKDAAEMRMGPPPEPDYGQCLQYGAGALKYVFADYPLFTNQDFGCFEFERNYER